MALVLIGKGLVSGGLTYKNRGHWGARYIYIYGTISPYNFQLITFITCWPPLFDIQKNYNLRPNLNLRVYRVKKRRPDPLISGW